MKKSAQRDDLRWCLAVLKSDLCLCGKRKNPRRSFCPYCFRALPDAMKAALYRKVGRGYEAAFQEAVQWLQINRW